MKLNVLVVVTLITLSIIVFAEGGDTPVTGCYISHAVYNAPGAKVPLTDPCEHNYRYCIDVLDCLDPEHYVNICFLAESYELLVWNCNAVTTGGTVNLECGESVIKNNRLWGFDEVAVSICSSEAVSCSTLPDIQLNDIFDEWYTHRYHTFPDIVISCDCENGECTQE